MQVHTTQRARHRCLRCAVQFAGFSAWALLTGLLAVSVAAQGVRSDDRLPDRPNIVVIFADDLGYGDLESYGHPTIRTPHLDQMAADGMRFTQFYSAASVCTPSRAGLLTGRYPVRTGLVGGILPGRVLFPNSSEGLRASEETIAELLKTAGYKTAAIGKWHLGHHPKYLPTAHGFDSYFGIPYSNDMDFVPARDGEPGYWNVPLLRDTVIVERPAVQATLTRRYTEEAVAFINRERDNPFFLYLAHSMPHIPLFASDEFRDTSARGLYGDVIEEIDWSTGEVLDAIESAGIAERTLVIFTSDNGPWLVMDTRGGSAGSLFDGKGTTWEGGMRVPAIAWWPGTVPQDVTSHALASTLDIMPTALMMANTTAPERELDGSSLLDVLRGEEESARDFFVYYRGDRVYAARWGPWKAHFFTQTEYPAGPLEPHDPPLLYQLEHDPEERFNVASEHPAVLDSIAYRMERHHAALGRSRYPTVEAEEILDGATVTGGTLQVQQMGNFGRDWGGDAQLWWVNARPGDRLTLSLPVSAAGTYDVVGFFTRARDYGIVRLYVDGKPIGDLMDGYAETVMPTGPITFGRVQLDEGSVVLAVEVVGKDVRSAGYSDGYLVGIDGFSLRPE